MLEKYSLQKIPRKHLPKGQRKYSKEGEGPLWPQLALLVCQVSQKVNLCGDWWEGVGSERKSPRRNRKCSLHRNHLASWCHYGLDFQWPPKVHADLGFRLWCCWVAVRPLESGALWDAVKSPEASLWEEKGDLSLFLSLSFLAVMEPAAPSAAMCFCNHDLTIVPEKWQSHPRAGTLETMSWISISCLSSLSQTLCDSPGKLTNSHCEQGQAHRRLIDTANG